MLRQCPAWFMTAILAIGAIAGLAMPILQRNLQPLLHALEGWRDVTRDGRRPATRRNRWSTPC